MRAFLAAGSLSGSALGFTGVLLSPFVAAEGVPPLCVPAAFSAATLLRYAFLLSVASSLNFANSCSSLGLNSPKSRSSRALRTSAGLTVFLFAACVCSLALRVTFQGQQDALRLINVTQEDSCLEG